ncbi:E3 ubiquitin-protein ligase NEURL3 isoform X1 [Pan troglodytes]|uniref:E3 ubiquitin-protein ligase NEURL3 isoform X1 n=1 Tax=Pan troglodytes TaxID=9598 RepID=UPI000511D8F7|nr:E3 ubiquitin-protein ligase NEURL3 isoform X2 [Pan troglodytes]
MGAQLCFEANAKAPREALRFHAEAKGAQVRLDTRGCIAHRRTTFHDGIVFSQRPVRLGERVALRVLREESGWCGGLRVGFTRLDPACVSVPSLPPFVCPDLEEQSPTWAAVLPEGCALTGDVVRFWVDRRGRLFAKVNAGCRLLLREGVPVGAPLWAVMDVYGTTKAIELLDPTASRLPTAMPWDLSNKAVPEPKGECLPKNQGLPGNPARGSGGRSPTSYWLFIQVSHRLWAKRFGSAYWKPKSNLASLPSRAFAYSVSYKSTFMNRQCYFVLALKSHPHSL